ncbi:MAG: GNAT family N-acetyltransferase [Pseudomonadota bacterium]
MHFVCYADWEQLPDSADALFAQAARESLFFSRHWFENLIAHGFDAPPTLLLACVTEGEATLALMPLLLRDSGHGESLTNLYASLFTLLVAEAQQEAIIHCLAQGLNRLPLNSLRLGPIAEDDSTVQRFEQAMAALGYQCQRRFAFYNWFHRPEGQGFADYSATQPGRVRNTIARKARKLDKEHGYSVRLFTDHCPAQALADYNRVYQNSWKANELYGDFVAGLAQRLARAGWLRLALLYAGETPIAAQLWFVAHGKASIFKLAYDEAWRHYSPGTILTSRLMARAIDVDRVQEIDFLTGNDRYKQEWMSQRRVRSTLHCFKTQPPRRRHSRLLQWLRRTTVALAP